MRDVIEHTDSAVAGFDQPTVTGTYGFKPRFRGYPDVLASVCAFPAVGLLTSYARPGLPTTAAIIYGFGLLSLFLASALYHTPQWSMHTRMLLRRVDHFAIYLLIAGSYTPFALLVFDDDSRAWIMGLVWGGTAFGLFKSFVWTRSSKAINTLVYMILGWLVLPYLPEIWRAIGSKGVALLAGGGIAYSVGAMVYVRRWPNPWPTSFGYHEIFHIFVLIAGALHFAVFWHLLT